ncbi:vesicle-associated membrane protein 3-like [Musca autumnalis]|uniref:vesicle-associated membrane protein 3-like n=1 Tax=Musca autumnalis TaxID=221902 RepID=UPI003CEE61EB
MATDKQSNVFETPCENQNEYSKNISNETDYRTPELLKQTKKDVDEVVEILHDNLKRAIDRQEKFEDLSDRAKKVEENASRFEEESTALKRKKLWKHMKSKIIIAIILAIILIILIATLVSSFGGS